MANIRDKILEKYGFDISQINLAKLYKIDTADLSDAELNQKISECHRKWNQSINGANEKFAERDKKHLENATNYEKALKDKKLREALIAFYFSNSNADNFAKEYFALIATTKTIKKKDVDFFFKYYSDQRKNKKDILEMLKKEYHVLASEKEEGNEEEGKKKDNNSALIVNRFQEATILKIHKCEDFLKTAASSPEICNKYPYIKNGLSDFLALGDIDSVDNLTAYVSHLRDDFFNLRQEKGTAYTPLVDLTNTITDILQYQDVVDNFDSFKILMSYPELTPYMYSLRVVKKKTMEQLFQIANNFYAFKNINDFAANYFSLVYENFNIDASAVEGMIKKAKKDTEKNEAVKKAKERAMNATGSAKWLANILYYLAYLPLFIVYFIFEIFRTICTNLRRLTVPIFITVFVLGGIYIPKFFDAPSIISLKALFDSWERTQFLRELTGEFPTGVIGTLALSLAAIVRVLATYVFPAYFVTIFFHKTIEIVNENVDWLGMRRTFKGIIGTLRNKSFEQFEKQKSLFFKQKIVRIITNIAFAVIMAVIIILL